MANTGRPPLDIVGLKFGRLTVKERRPAPGKSHNSYWLCECDCGATTVAKGCDLKRGVHVSCGCFRTPHGMSKSPTYMTWLAMRERCRNPKLRMYRHYGGRGIRVCKRWDDSFEAFLADMGEKPPNTSIDRIDNDGHYEPGNCRWALHVEQSSNTSRSVIGPLAAILIRQLAIRGSKATDLSHAFGVMKQNAAHIRAGRQWAQALAALERLS